MADTLTTFMSLVKQTIGGNRNTWGNILNANLDLIDSGLAGQHAVSTTGGTTTLGDTEYIKRIINVTGTLSSNAIIQFPNKSGFWIVRNGTTGGSYTVTAKTASGSAVDIIRGGFTLVWCDGNDVMRVGASSTFLDTQARAPAGTLAAPGMSWLDELASGFYRVSSGVFAWVVAGVERLRVSATAFAILLADTGTATVKIDATTVVTVAETGVAVVGNLTVNGVSILPVGTTVEYDGITAPNGWLLKYGQAVSRTTYSELLAALTATATATRNGTTSLTSVSADLTNLGLEGAAIEGTGIPSSTTIVSLTATTITLSQAASGSGSMTIRALPHGNGDGSTTFNIPDDRGRAVVGRDNMGGTSANRLTGQTGGLNGDKLGTTGGAETHTLTTAELAAHSHAVNDPGHSHGLFSSAPTGAGSPGGNANSTSTSAAFTGITINNAGGDDAHNNVQPSRVSNKIIFTNVFA
jgi:microcystin-dependent protein